MATTAEKLAEARDTYHRIMTGQAPSEVQIGDQKLRYSELGPMMADKVQAYIRSLEQQLAREEGRAPTRRARGVIF